MTAKPPPLAEPIEIGKFWKNRRRNVVVVTSLSAYEETNIVNVREYFVGTDGIMRPSTKGIAMSVRRLPELSNTIRKALETARRLDLLPEDGGE